MKGVVWCGGGAKAKQVHKLKLNSPSSLNRINEMLFVWTDEENSGKRRQRPFGLALHPHRQAHPPLLPMPMPMLQSPLQPLTRKKVNFSWNSLINYDFSINLTLLSLSLSLYPSLSLSIPPQTLVPLANALLLPPPPLLQTRIMMIKTVVVIANGNTRKSHLKNIANPPLQNPRTSRHRRDMRMKILQKVAQRSANGNQSIRCLPLPLLRLLLHHRPPPPRIQILHNHQELTRNRLLL